MWELVVFRCVCNGIEMYDKCAHFINEGNEENLCIEMDVNR